MSAVDNAGVACTTVLGLMYELGGIDESNLLLRHRPEEQQHSSFQHSNWGGSGNPSSILASADGHYLYLTNQTAAAPIEPSSGALTAGQSMTVQANCNLIVIDPHGRLLYLETTEATGRCLPYQRYTLAESQYGGLANMSIQPITRRQVFVVAAAIPMAAEAQIYLDPSINYRSSLNMSGGSLGGDTDSTVPMSTAPSTAPSIGAVLHPRTAAEVTAAVTPTNLQYSTSPYDPRRYGAAGDGVTDDTRPLQSWIKVLQASGNEGFLPAAQGSGYLITSALVITAPVNIRGAGISKTCILASGCDAITIAAGVSQVTMENFRINQRVRYTKATNTYTGIHSLGTSSKPCTTHSYRNIFIDGFQTAINGNGMQESDFDNCTCVFGYNGLLAATFPVNLRLRACVLQCGDGTRLAGSIGVQFGDGTTAAQGCTISDSCVIIGFDTNVWLNGANFCKIVDSYLDFCNGINVLIQSGSGRFPNAATNNDILNNYMAHTAAANAGVRCRNTTASYNPTGNKISDNTIIVYANGLSFGVLVDGTHEKNNLICRNTVNAGSGDSAVDVAITQGTGHIVVGNSWQGKGFSSTVRVTYDDNVGAMITNPNASVFPPRLGIVQNTLGFATNIATDLNTGNNFLVSANSNAAFNFTNPVNPPTAGGVLVSYTIKNISGGSIATPTWGTAFKIPAVPYPSNGSNRTYTFLLGTAAADYVLVSFTGADVPN